MKKIGILTFHRSVNNGAAAQAYALSTRLAKEYPNAKVEIVDFHMEKVAASYRYTIARHIKGPNFIVSLKRIALLLLDPNYLRRLNKRSDLFAREIDKLPTSAATMTDASTSLDRLFDYVNANYDALIVGSDAVWNYASRGFPNAYFPDERVKISKLGYAASCYGMEFIEYAKDRRERIGEILNGFEFLGVRDVATEDFVKWSGCVKTPTHVCDPTAFLDLSALPVDESALLQKLKERKFDFSRPTIGMMGNDQMCSMIRRLYGKKYQIVALYNPIRRADINLYDLTPYEWARVFRYFKIVFTTYFHGTMLSLRNGVPAICVALHTDFSKKHTTKVLDVLQRVGYTDWYFSTDYKGENFEQIRSKADELMAKDMKAEILSRIDEEAKSFDEFKKVLDRVLNEEK